MKRILPLLLLPVVASGADSAASGFAADVAAGYSESPHGQLMIVSGSVDAVGDGETALSLWVGRSLAGMQCVERRAVTQTGTQTFRYQSPRALGDWDYWWVKMEQTPDGATTNETWFPSYNAGNNWIHYRDGSFYEWTGPASGTWQDTANWTQTAEVEYGGAKTGYPAWEITGGAIFPAGSAVDLSFSGDVNPDTLRLGEGVSLALHGANRAPRVAFDRVFATGSTVAGSGWRNLASFVVDGVDLWYTPVVGAVAAGASFVVTNGGRWVVGDDFWPQQGSGATVRLAPGSVLETRGVYLAIPDGLVEIDGATWIEDGEGFYTYTGGGGSKTVFKGDAPALVFTVASASCGSGKNVDCTLEFDLPAGGWTLPPVRGAAGGTKAFATPYNDNGKVVVSVPADCPAATTDGMTDAVLVSWPGGFDTTHLVYGSLPNPATDSFYIANNPDTNVPELHARIFGQAQGEADPTVTAVTVGGVTRTGATLSAAVMPGGSASSAEVSLLVSANGGSEFVATNETISTAGTVVFPIDGLPSGATCTARFRVVNSYGRSAVSDPVVVRLLASYAEFVVAGAGVSLSRAGKDTVAEFTADGTFTVLRGGAAEVLVVAGGGAGGASGATYAGGGGGAGGVLHLEDLWLDAGDYAVVVGAGGAAAASRSVLGGNGGDSSFWSYHATGGGAGCSPYVGTGARSGGSGGGGVGDAFAGNYGANAGLAGQGHDGGRGTGGWIPGGGGGAGAAGSAAAAGQAGAGGAGLAFAIGKKTYEVGGGGGGGSYSGAAPGGATHGGGAGGAAGASGADGAAATGGGGGGAGASSADLPSGAGGAGVVVVRMRTGGNGLLILVK